MHGWIRLLTLEHEFLLADKIPALPFSFRGIFTIETTFPSSFYWQGERVFFAGI